MEGSPYVGADGGHGHPGGEGRQEQVGVGDGSKGEDDKADGHRVERLVGGRRGEEPALLQPDRHPRYGDADDDAERQFTGDGPDG